MFSVFWPGDTEALMDSLFAALESEWRHHCVYRILDEARSDCPAKRGFQISLPLPEDHNKHSLKWYIFLGETSDYAK